jgi:hypothetical protein
MKKLISVSLLSAVAMLAAATTPAPKAQDTTTAPAAVKAATKKVHKKHHVAKTKAAVKPAAVATPAK